jgi:ribosomal subunit interface protein
MIPIQITYRHFPASEALSALIRDESSKLERFSDRITRCHVVVEIPHKHRRTGRHFHVRVDVAVPGCVLTAGREPDEHAEHENAFLAVSEAFECSRRQLQEYGRRLRHEGQRDHAMP